MEQSRIEELRLLAEAHKLKRKSAQIILECLSEIERLQKRNGKRAKFQPPTLDDAVAYAFEIKLDVEEAEKFLDHHTAREWKSCRTKIVDWRAALRTWKRNTIAFSKSATSKNGTSQDPARWTEFCTSKGLVQGQYRFAPEYLRLEFSRWLKGAEK